MEAQARPRLEWIDVLKGIGIVAVVFGHVVPGTAHDVTFLFHMPLFFFLAGCLHKACEPRRQLEKSAKRLLVPYLAFLTVFFLPTLFLQQPHAGLGDAFRLVAKFVYGGYFLAGFVGVVWFVTCLFFTQQVVNWMCRWPRMRQIATFALMAVLAYANAFLKPELHLPLALNVVFAAAPLFYIGMVTKRVTWNAWKLATCFVIAGLSLVAALKGVPVAWDMKQTDYGLPVVSIVTAFAWFVCLSRASQWIAAVPGVSALLASLGRMSMGIMFLHQFAQIALHDFAGVSNDWLRGCLALAASFALSLVLNYFDATRVLFLGEAKKRRVKEGRGFAQRA
jgi:polysaccharide biosynthesis protein PslL